MTVSDELARLAAAHGVATQYNDQLDRPVRVSADSVVAVLHALGVDASTPAAVNAALADVEARPTTPPVIVMRASERRRVPLTTPSVVVLESGGEVDVEDDTIAGLPTGWHALRSGETVVPLVVAPDRLSRPQGRHWGLMVQLYAMRSERSWGIGDLHELSTLSDWTAGNGGDVVLVKPLHASAPMTPKLDTPN